MNSSTSKILKPTQKRWEDAPTQYRYWLPKYRYLRLDTVPIQPTRRSSSPSHPSLQPSSRLYHRLTDLHVPKSSTMLLTTHTALLALTLLSQPASILAQDAVYHPYCTNQVFGVGFGWCWGSHNGGPLGGRCKCVCTDGEVDCKGNAEGWPYPSGSSFTGVDGTCPPELAAGCKDVCHC